jgi:iron complex transport system substrate-binding protein
MKVASLVPSATESLFALGLGQSVVGVTHECDWPDAARELPQLTRSEIDPGLTPGEVDAAVRDATARGDAIYGLDAEALERLDPDLIVTQALCAVCAVSYDDVCRVAQDLPGRSEVLSLDPETLDDVLDDLVRLGEACDAAGAAHRLRTDLEARLEAVAAGVAGASAPRVVALEWLDPPFIGGHWVPEMITRAGGHDVVGRAGEKSRTATWDELAAARPDIVLVMPCGLHCEEAASQAAAYAARIRAIGASQVWAVDAASSFSRPGPRLVDGVELLAHIFHPDRTARPEGLDCRRLVDLEGTA